jgi:MFS transporter, ACS family, hexuronate transporter
MAMISPRLRWALFATLCLAGVFNAMDRPIIAILKPDMMADFGWTDSDFGDLAAVTQFSAAFAFLFTGWLVDRIGVNRSMQVGASAWSVAAIAHGWATTMGQVVAARVGLGVTEAVQTPLTIKTVATLFEPDRRSFAFGVATFVASAGTISIPFIIPFLAEAFGWRGALVAGGIGGFLSLALWLWLARGLSFAMPQDEPVVPARSDGDAGDHGGYGPILTNRRTWAIVIAKAISDMTWWLLNFWLADYYRKEFGLSTLELAVPLGIAFAGSGVGALFAGWLSSRLLGSGWPVNRVRKTVMLVSALIVLPLPLVLQLNAFWPVAIMMGVVMAGHQGFSLSIFSIITDVVPTAKVARVTAFGAFMGNMGGVAISLIAGRVLDAGFGFGPLFLIAACSYLVALAWLHLLLPRIQRDEGALASVVA